MKTKLINEVVVFIRWLIVCLRYIEETLQPSQVEKPYTGGEAILPGIEVMHIQPGLANVFGERKALIVQKIHEWVLVNQGKGTHQYDGMTWTYGSYKDWHDRHFSWFSANYLGKLLKQLVDDGFLIATDEAPFCYKGQFAYRINYLKISESVPWQKLHNPSAKIEQPLFTNCSEGMQKLNNNNIEIQEPQNNLINQSETTTSTARAHEPLPPAQTDDVVAETQESEIDIFGGMGEFITDDTAPITPIREGQETPPDSASPPSADEHDALVADMIAVAGFFPTSAKRLIAETSPERCQAVVAYIKDKKPSMDNPPGWFTAVLHKGEIPEDYGKNSGDNPYKSGKWADIINS